MARQAGRAMARSGGLTRNGSPRRPPGEVGRRIDRPTERNLDPQDLRRAVSRDTGLPPGSKSWHRTCVTFLIALRRLLPLLAVLSLALTPVAAPAAAAGMRAFIMAQAAPEATSAIAHAEMEGMDVGNADMADMPCCPPGKVAKPDCAKAGCPLLALCLASVASLLPTAASVPAPVATRTSRVWPDAASFASVSGRPLPEPPRA